MARDERLDLPAELDALLRQTMTVEPSASFLPRARQRITDEQPRAMRFRAALLFGGVGLAAACLLALSLVPLGSEAAPQAPPAPVPHVTEAIPVADPAVVAHRSPPPVIARVPAAAPRVTPVQRAPEVVVDQRQRAALSTMIRLITEGTLTDDRFARTTPASLNAIRNGIVPVGVPPLTVSAIGGDGVLQKDTERK